MDEILSEFIAETLENLESLDLDLDLVRLEKEGANDELLGSIFRVMHTIKGTCGFLDLARLEKIAHAGEDILGKIRDGHILVDPVSIGLVLEAADRIKFIVKNLEENQVEPDGNDDDLIEKINEFTDLFLNDDNRIAEPCTADQTFIIDEDVIQPDAVEVVLDKKEEIENSAGQDHKAPEDDSVSASSNAGVSKGEGDIAQTSLRVSVPLLESLMTTVQELVLTRNQLLQISRNQKDSEFSVPLQRLNQVVSELQEGVMKTRMQPIGNAWSKLPRIIRDINQDLGKDIILDMKGNETELDRQVLEMIKDPLTHMVRNSADHGIETPEERMNAGKPVQGRITLNAYHEGGHIIIKIKDDGRGICTDKIRAKILEKALASEDDLKNLSHQQILQYIFRPGFTTATHVTSLSGRGVGMDVVRTNIEKIGGIIKLSSDEGIGTTFTIKIPLTLAIVSALILEAGGERFAMPQISVVELVRTSAGKGMQIEYINGTPLFRLRNRLLPLVRLSEMLGLESEMGRQDNERENGSLDQISESFNAANKKQRKNEFIVVTQVGSYTFGIVVDRVYDTEEIVVKPIASFLRYIDVYSGNTILGDGSVIMILDPNGIASHAGELPVAEHADTLAAEDQQIKQDDKISLPMFRTGQHTQCAVPLSLVARIEDIPKDRIESADGRLVVQYRGQLMPLIPYSDDAYTLVQQGFDDAQFSFPVIVFTDGVKAVGLIVVDIVDIVEEKIDIQLGAKRPDLIGTAIISGHVTDVIDVGHYLHTVYNQWFDEDASHAHAKTQKRRIMVVDDSPFFLNMVVPLLTSAGYEVTAVDSVEKALDIIDHQTDLFDLIISDIEMPEINGFEFIERIRTQENLNDLPIIALSSHNSSNEIHRGQLAGFNDYVAKFDRKALLKSVSTTLDDYGDGNRLRDHA